MDVAEREWRLIREETWDGPMNMALDEVAARTAAAGGPRTVRLYRWGPSTLSLGYNQDPETVAWEWCAENGVTVTRRPTGGGGIYHDYTGDISYSIIGPAEEFPSKLLDCYHLLCEPVLDAFHAMGVDADYVEGEVEEIYHPACYLRALHPAHDMVAGERRRKIAGNAQYRQREAVIQHGSLSYALTPDRHLACFDGHDVTPERFRERVTAMVEEADVSRPEAVRTVEDALANWSDAVVGEWTDDELALARELAEEKYASEAWTRDGEDPTTE
ncbi:lipoate--protein ligase family protein [Halospeciosus flavus]|uniref:Biotin/lipoate A/B protein ligase family protein n=1 Tax=Halospeciosus flavus TaxID=3032283 RepID=A0ABD5Z5L9_9EURY|nr:biotin/lipoate A/B protein ligase family protein [Halospeciosus flavus]